MFNLIHSLVVSFAEVAEIPVKKMYKIIAASIVSFGVLCALRLPISYIIIVLQDIARQ